MAGLVPATHAFRGMNGDRDVAMTLLSARAAESSCQATPAWIAWWASHPRL